MMVIAPENCQAVSSPSELHPTPVHYSRQEREQERNQFCFTTSVLIKNVPVSLSQGLKTEWTATRDCSGVTENR